MTLYETVKTIEKIASLQPDVKAVGDGSIYDIMNANPSMKYASVVVSQTTHRETDEFDYYGFNIFYSDRLDDTLKNNRLQIQSAAKETLSNIFKVLKREYDWEFTQILYHPFTQKFVDECAGQYATVEIGISKDIICEEDFDE